MELVIIGLVVVAVLYFGFFRDRKSSITITTVEKTLALNSKCYLNITNEIINDYRTRVISNRGY